MDESHKHKLQKYKTSEENIEENLYDLEFAGEF
jgi:hypothetical protein